MTELNKLAGRRWLRRLLFRWAFKGLSADQPEALAYAREAMNEPSLENEIRTERALVLKFWVEWICK